MGFNCKKMMSVVMLSLLLVATFAFTACGKTETTPEVKEPALNINETAVIFQVGETKELTATLENFTDTTTVIFAAANTSIVSVKQAGNKATVTAKKIGTTDVTVKAGDITKTCAFTVTKADTIVLSKDIMFMQDSAESTWPGKDISAIFDSAKTDATVTFTSSDENIVKVKSVSDPVAEEVPEGATPTTNKVITAILEGTGAGEATITATIGNKTKTCSVQVSNSEILYSQNGDKFEIAIDGIISGKTITGALYIPDQAFLYSGFYPITLVRDGTKPATPSTPPTDAELNDPNRLPLTGAFMGIKTITSVHYGRNVMSTGMGAFYNSGITKITFHPDCAVKTVGDWCFAGTKITECYIPNNSADGWYGRGIFANCTELVKVQLPDSYEGMRIHLFYNCSKLDELYIPATIANGIFADAFGHDDDVGAAPLTKLYYSGSSANWTTLLAQANVNSTGNSTIINYVKTNIYYGATGLGTGTKS
jgi:hypothetical protein